MKLETDWSPTNNAPCVEIVLAGITRHDEMMLFGPKGADQALNGKWSVGAPQPSPIPDGPMMVFMSGIGRNAQAFIAADLLASLIQSGYAREITPQPLAAHSVRSSVGRQIPRASAPDRFDKQAEAHGEAEAWREGFHGLIVVRESEKAIAVEVALSVDGTGTGTTLAWFPKSRCKEEDGVWMAQGWLIRRNLGEALQYKKGRHTHYRLEGRIHIVGGEVFEVA